MSSNYFAVGFGHVGDDVAIASYACDRGCATYCFAFRELSALAKIRTVGNNFDVLELVHANTYKFQLTSLYNSLKQISF